MKEAILKSQIQNVRGCAPEPAGGAYSVPPVPVAGGEGLAAPSPRTPPRPRLFGPLGPLRLALSIPAFLQRVSIALAMQSAVLAMIDSV